MAIEVRYIGTKVRYSETPVTGKQTVWNPGQAFDVPDADAALLLATGQFARADAGTLTPADITATKSLVSSAGSLASPMLIAKTNATFSRASANTAADNTFGTLYSFLLPGGSMGPNGTLRWEAELGFTDPNTNAGTTVGFQLRIGATAISPEVGGTYTVGQTFANQSLEWHNTAVAAQKYRGSFAKNGGSGSGFFTTAIDTAVDQTIDFACRWSAATPSETLSLLSLRVWVEYGA